MKIRFLTIAEIEVDEAVSWYQRQSEDQDLNFLDEFVRAIRVITAREPGYWADRVPYY